MNRTLTRFAVVLALALTPLMPGPLAAKAVAGTAPSYTYMHMTTIESVVAGGLGRSRILFTPEFKGQKEATLENLFSLTGININNVRTNEQAIVQLLNDITSEGWELVQAVPLTQTLQSAGTTGQGIFLTRYTFRKAK
ncbi:hypothetical protein [Hymenobacter sp. BT730]|uniref:hypothetical protein n=1 Tax=Hymenobacter sp. BT730 TaxID=3063332 RepID=UPI0026E0EED5|nr:hypothetical protein [Hymenobacter sp. BT730]